MKAFLFSTAVRFVNVMLQPVFRRGQAENISPPNSGNIIVLRDCSPDLTRDHSSTRVPLGLVIVLALLVLFALLKITSSY